jgi:two-component system invasion response regulator UvrY
MAEGKTIKDIAALLGLSVKTVSTYRARMFKKLNFKSTAELVRYAVRENIIRN